MTEARLRAVAGVRLSVLTDETTSPERQMLANQGAADTLGADIVATATDLDVSATATTPFDRPELGRYLATPDTFDMIIWWRLDRAVRSMADMSALTQWAKEHGKRLVFAEGPGGAMLELDMRSASPTAEMIAMLFAFAAQMEAVAVQERVTGAHAALRRAGRWAGGIPPYGYRKAPLPKGAGYKLVHDPTALEHLMEIIARVMRGDSIVSIVRYLEHEARVPSPQEYHLLREGKERRRGRRTGPRRWSHSSLSHMLRSPALMGHRTYRGRTVRTPDGEPIMVGDPILTREEWDALQAALDARSSHSTRTRKDTKALLLNVIKCGGCGIPMYRADRRDPRYPDRADYSCRASARAIVCPAPCGILADVAEAFTEREFLALMGRSTMVRIVERQGYDPGPELRELEAELVALYAEKDNRRSAVGRRVWQEQVNALEARAETLEATPKREPSREIEETGETYAQYWARHGTEGRRRLLLDAGVQVSVTKGRRGGTTPTVEEIERRLTFTIERDDPEADVIMYDLS